jgi:hypothetical protein
MQRAARNPERISSAAYGAIDNFVEVIVAG